MRKRDWHEVDGMSGLRVIAVWLVLCALVSSVFMLGIKGSDVEDVAVSAIDGADQAVADAYHAVLEAESAAADVSGLLERLDVAAKYLASARMCLTVGDFDCAVGNASFCVEALEGMVNDAGVLRDRASRQRYEHSWRMIGGSTVGVAVAVCVTLFGWRLFRRRYCTRFLKMKPEVSEGES